MKVYAKVRKNGEYHSQNIPNRPMGCSIDFAVVVKDGKERTVFLEMNDGYALGNYGLYHLSYAKLISARWSQLLGREDVFDFGKIKGGE